MPYIVGSDALGLAIGTVAETADGVPETLSKARQMYETGMVSVSITDQAGHKIDGDELLACITEKKTITEDLQAVWEIGSAIRNSKAHVTPVPLSSAQ